MGELQIVGLIFLGIIIIVGGGALCTTALQVDDDKAKEQWYREITHISEAEGELIRQILKQHKFQLCYAKYESYDMPNINGASVATNLALKGAEEFAILNGYSKDIITKLYYNYNMNHGRVNVVNKIYSVHNEPHTDLLTGEKVGSYNRRSLEKVQYNIEYFVLQ